MPRASASWAGPVLELLFEEPTVGRCLAAPDGRVLRASGAWLRATGLTAEQAVGADLLTLLAGAGAGAEAPALHARARAGETVVLPRRARHLGGRETWWEGRLEPVPMEDGTGLLLTERAVEERARPPAAPPLRDSERVYRAIGESIDFGVWVCEPDGRNVYASESFLKLVGLTQEQCSNFGWGEVLHPDDAARTIAAWKECVRTGAKWDIEHRFRGVDGAWHPVLARGVPVRDDRGEVICWAGINLDISALKRAQEALLEADRRKSEFLAVLSHELRNPLAPILNAAFVLRRPDVTPDQAERARTIVERQVKHLARLVDDLLDVTRIANGKIELRRARVDLREVAARAAEDLRAVVEQRGQTLRVALPAAPLWAEADGTRLEQVIANLLQNAAKFSGPGDRITLALRAVGGELELAVRDTGVGIDPALLPTIFEPFVQGQRTLARAGGGLGLGLALVKGLAELHGGRVSASSAGPGSGAEFVVRLPAAPGAPAPDPTAPGDRARPGRRQVLVVDDNQDGADSLAQVVELLGHDAVVAYDGLAAVELARAAVPDVVLCDIGLPGMDGYQVARALRAQGARARLYALTGYAQPGDVAAALAAGFDGHVAKPVDIAAVERILGEPGPGEPAGGHPRSASPAKADRP